MNGLIRYLLDSYVAEHSSEVLDSETDIPLKLSLCLAGLWVKIPLIRIRPGLLPSHFNHILEKVHVNGTSSSWRICLADLPRGMV